MIQVTFCGHAVDSSISKQCGHDDWLPFRTAITSLCFSCCSRFFSIFKASATVSMVNVAIFFCCVNWSKRKMSPVLLRMPIKDVSLIKLEQKFNFGRNLLRKCSLKLNMNKKFNSFSFNDWITKRWCVAWDTVGKHYTFCSLKEVTSYPSLEVERGGAPW